MGDAETVSANAGAGDPAESVVAPDVVEVAIRPSVDQGGAKHRALGVIGPLRGSGETFEVLAQADGCIVVRPVGDLDLSTVPELEATVGRVLSGRGGRIVIDASELEFADSSAIALWVRWANRTGQVEIRDPSPMLRGRILKMGLADRLRLRP